MSVAPAVAACRTEHRAERCAEGQRRAKVVQVVRYEIPSAHEPLGFDIPDGLDGFRAPSQGGVGRVRVSLLRDRRASSPRCSPVEIGDFLATFGRSVGGDDLLVNDLQPVDVDGELVLERALLGASDLFLQVTDSAGEMFREKLRFFVGSSRCMVILRVP